MLELARYVVLNPVLARMVNDVADWPWSSYAAMVGTQATPPWLETDGLLAHFGQRRSSAVAKYVDFVRADVGLPPAWESLRGPVFMGVLKPKTGEAPDRATRDTLMAQDYASGHYSMREIAERYAVHVEPVSRAVARHDATDGRTSAPGPGA